MTKTNPLLMLLLTLFGCSPSQHNPGRFGTVMVYVDNLVVDNSRLIPRALDKLDTLGPDFLLTNTLSEAALIIRQNPSPRPSGVCDTSLVLDTASKTLTVDSACLNTGNATIDNQATGSIAHIIAHSVGMHHVCTQEQRVAGFVNCSPVGYGNSLLNYATDTPFRATITESITDYYSNRTTTQLDIDEYNRITSP